MTVTITRIWRFCFALVAVSGVTLSSGCRDKEKTGGVARGDRSDPLLAGPGRIPPQNLSMPGRDGTAGGRNGDPLLGSPTGRPTERSGYTDDPSRFKGPYVPSAGSVPAALSARQRDGEELRIERPGGPDPLLPPVQPASGRMPPASIDNTPAEAKLIELETYGVKQGDYSLERDANGYVIRAKLAIGENGAVRQYTQTGATVEEALAELIRNIKSDGRK